MLNRVKCIVTSGGPFHILQEFGKYSLVKISRYDVEPVKVSPLVFVNSLVQED